MLRSTTPPRTGRPLLRRGPAAIAVALLLTAASASCTGGDDGPEATDATPTTPAPESVAMVAEVSQVAGSLKRAARAKVADQVTKSLQEYADAAFLGDYPRSDFGTAFASFTPGAARSAQRDRDLLTGASFRQAESVTATKLNAKVSVLAPRGRVAGATARVRIVLDVDGTPVTVTGRLVLTPEKREWRIFGYDLSSDAADALVQVQAGGATGGDS